MARALEGDIRRLHGNDGVDAGEPVDEHAVEPDVDIVGHGEERIGYDRSGCEVARRAGDAGVGHEHEGKVDAVGVERDRVGSENGLANVTAREGMPAESSVS